MRWLQRGTLLVYVLIILIPLLVVLFGSVKTSAQLYQNPFALPLPPTGDNFRELLSLEYLGRPFLNSVIVTGASLLIALFVASLAAYGIARIPGWRGWLIYGFLVIGIAVPAQAIMIPLYVMFSRMGLLNSLIGLILIEVVNAIPVAVFILGGFMRTLPRELFEASAVDGSGPWRTYQSIVLPLSAPALAATTIFLFVILWNDLLYPLLIVSVPELRTLPLALLSFQGEFETNYPAMFAGVILASAPVVAAYVFLQRYFVAGMTAGASKG